MKISAYIPCFNNRETIGLAIASIREQIPQVDELFVVDDGSTDGSAEHAISLDVRVVEQPENKGRGSARSVAMARAAHELVLCCDAAKTLGPDFVQNAIPWFEDAGVAAVFGWITQPPPVDVVGRWRGRHLFKTQPMEARHQARLTTSGAVLRATAVAAVGGFRPELRMGEDTDLGERLLAAGYDVVSDPVLRIVSITPNTLLQVLERYWRWNTAPHGRMAITDYLRQIIFSIKVMAREDLIAHDPAAALVSLLSPHYQYWKSLVTRRE